ncbi:succinylglutamate desuccinylase [Vibrio mangrovi]|uniref:Succinylglutamate desuccinylase n=1 Tax=Vibrio mangrovi TaxID=474394 RepID=A0A1Y6IMU6_9VIBR|nr:succinylglutamate desuccinylase [Vibrio mangrovi]MDW6004233.1 succinylglutamate desuccinylase [Vibrio mangrovi]SMR98968.1 Succinylglutamate desuccinylase [Vibrio mangrovi]
MSNSLFRQSFLIDSLYSDGALLSSEYTTDDGVLLKLHCPGVLEVIPPQLDEKTQHIVVSCAIHGKDAGPVELVNRIVSDIESGFQPVREHCLFIIAHLEALKHHTQFFDENLERLFDDKPRESSQELVIADNLKIFLKAFWKETSSENRWHFDLHSTLNPSSYHTFAISPKVRHTVRPKALVNFVELSHLDALVLANAPSSSFSWYTADCYSARSLAIALGQSSRLGQSLLDRFNAFDITLRDLCAREPNEHLPRKTKFYRVSRTIVRMNDDFDFIFSDEVENFTAFVHGEVFGHDGDKPLMAKNEGEAILFPDKYVSVGEQAALMVCPVTVRYEQDQLVYD